MGCFLWVHGSHSDVGLLLIWVVKQSKHTLGINLVKLKNYCHYCLCLQLHSRKHSIVAFKCSNKLNISGIGYEANLTHGVKPWLYIMSRPSYLS